MAQVIYFPTATDSGVGIRQCCHVKLFGFELWAGLHEMPHDLAGLPWFERRGDGEYWFGSLQVCLNKCH
jgi:hypothetical protein